jgi:hypothetical protein
MRQKPKGTINGRFIVVTSASVLIAFSIGCASRILPGIKAPKAPTTLNWDLSQSQELRNIGWEAKAPVDNSLQKNYLQEDGDFDLILKLSEGRVFHERVRHIYVTKRDSKITVLTMATFPMTLDEAQAKARQLIDYWKFDPRNLGDKSLEEWCAARRKGTIESDDTKFETNKNFTYPSLSLGVPSSFDPRKPWFLLFSVEWLKPGDPL